MGSLCSKEQVNEEEYVPDRLQPQKAPSQTLKQLITLTSKEDSAVVAPVVHAVIGRSESNVKAKAQPTTAPGAEKNAPVLVIASLNKSYSYSTAGLTHHRRPTVDAGDHDAAAAAAAEPIPQGVPQGFSGEHVIAGWPSCNVYMARDLQSGKIVALKRVRFVNMDPESVRFMAREIHILRRLDHPNVIKLEGIVTSCLSHSLYLVFEYMEHDLAGLAATPGLRFTEPQVKCFMRQILAGLHHCHGRGVLHRDIKGSNLLIDDNGVLKIADFGLATFFDPAKTQHLTSRVVTLWYRRRSSCSEPPSTESRSTCGIEQLHKIFKLCGSPSEEYWVKAKLPDVTLFKPQRPYRRRTNETFRDFPPTALDLLDTLLAIEPSHRGTAASALDSQRSQARNNPRSSSHHYNTLEDSMSGFRMEPRAAAGPPSTIQNVGQFGSTWYRKDDQRDRAVQRTTSSVRVSNHAPHLTSQRSYATSRGTDLHPSSSATRNTNSKYNRLDVAEPATR
ncbi:putative serine/threonine-protein kinase [Hordeum vulgare]|nr:putative serine/threonine-protein kinase [Hordeum vulgare]